LITYETMDTYDDTGNNTEARLGWIGRVNYDFANKYLVELSAATTDPGNFHLITVGDSSHRIFGLENIRRGFLERY
jgi:hypothetical protein